MDVDVFYDTIAGYGLRVNGDKVLVAETEDKVLRFVNFVTETKFTYKGNSIEIKSIETLEYDRDAQTLMISTYGDKEYNIHGKKTTAVKRFDDKLQMPKTDSELTDIFPILYPDYQAKLFYDTMMEREIVDISIFDDTVPEGTFVSMD